MRTRRPRTPIATHGAINTRREGGRVVAETRVRDRGGRLHQVRASGPTAAAARTRLMGRIDERPSLPSSGVLRPSSSFADLVDLRLADLELRDLAGNTKENYRACLRLQVRPVRNRGWWCKAVLDARRRADDAGVGILLAEGSVTALRDVGLGTGYRLDIECDPSP